MSGRKYVPSFLRNQTGANGGAAGGAGSNVNRFAAFDDDFEAPKTAVASTAAVAPALKPATLASLTSDSKPAGGGRSYASRFSDRTRRDDKPTTAAAPAAPKTDIKSVEQFPTLGGAAKKPAGAWGKPTSSAAGGEKLSTLAKEWAKKKEEEEAAAEALRLAEEKKRHEEEMLALALKNSMRRGVSGGLENPDYSEEDYFHNPYAAQELLADEDSVELPSEEEPMDDDLDDDEYDENDEHNPNIAYDGRRKDDLY